MSEKISINVGVFSIEPSQSDLYNEPIGLALYNDSEDQGISVLLARHGHHQPLYDAYLKTLPEDQRSEMPRIYHEAVDAYGFLSRAERMPAIYCTNRYIYDKKRILAAQALFVALELRAYIIRPDDNKMHPMRVSKEHIDRAVVQNLTLCDIIAREEGLANWAVFL